MDLNHLLVVVRHGVHHLPVSVAPQVTLEGLRRERGKGCIQNHLFQNHSYGIHHPIPHGLVACHAVEELLGDSGKLGSVLLLLATLPHILLLGGLLVVILFVVGRGVAGLSGGGGG